MAADRSEALEAALLGEIAVAVAKREELHLDLRECTAFVAGLDASAVALSVDVDEAFGGADPVPDTNAEDTLRLGA